MSKRRDETVTAARERKFQTAKRRPVTFTRGNIHSSDYVTSTLVEAAYIATSELFTWLSVDTIMHPPRNLVDAKLARQVAVTIMVRALNLPQREVARIQHRQRTHIHFAVRAVESRLEDPMFVRAYKRAAASAVAIAKSRLRQAAA